MDLSLSVDEFVRSIAVNRAAPHALFLGAGASISSGVPSADTCTWLWKRDIFLSRNPGLGNQFDDISLSSVRARIQRWLDTEGGFPGEGSDDEYGFYAQKCYPIAEDRRRFFQGLITGVRPYVGYELLVLLSESNLMRSVWTTNFDGLTAKAAANSQLVPVEVTLDAATRIFRQPQTGELLIVSIHGDYRYDKLKNTNPEIQEFDGTLHGELDRSLDVGTLIVSGYSGRDGSIMETLGKAMSRKAAGRLFWCGYGPDIPAAVQGLLLQARAAGREAYFVPTLGFDDVMSRLALACLSDEKLEKARELSVSKLFKSEKNLPPFDLTAPHVRGVTKSNLYPIECPSDVLQFHVSGLDVKGAWKLLREKIAGSKIVAGLQKGRVLAIGDIGEVKHVFSDCLTTDISRVPIEDRDYDFSDGVIVSLLTEALVKGLADTYGLGSDGKRLLWRKEKKQDLSIDGKVLAIHDAVLVSIRRYCGRQFLAIKPTLRSVFLDGSEPDPDLQMEVKRQLLTRQWNREFDQALDCWRNSLITEESVTISFPVASASGFSFRILGQAALGRFLTYNSRDSISVPRIIEDHVVFSGAQFKEPKLLFSNKQANATARDEHSIRGLLQNRPYDFPLAHAGIADEVRVGVVCPARDAPALGNYLGKLNEKRLPNSKKEYLLEYPGFSRAFGVNVDVPQKWNAAWVDCSEPNGTATAKEGALDLAKKITSAIDQAKAAASPNVIVIYVPERWKPFERFRIDEEFFDLHDYIKAYCVQRGVATQFIRERTLTKIYQGEVMWWLALSIYIKAMRTPWALEMLNDDTAYVGLGFSLDPSRPTGRHVILGCSHIYNSSGIGLSYKLSKIERPTIIQGNPFMSTEDARRVGESIRQQFYESMQRLPKRVVIHRRTQFLQGEKAGLLDGLSGVSIVDMLEINVESAIRSIAYRFAKSGNFYSDMFPIRRGSALLLDARKALLWVHGTSDAIQQSANGQPLSYYLGKSRIPAPLTIIRHFGNSHFSDLAREILGLSKMSLNSFDLYTKLPATIKSSNEIARIGSLLERLGPVAYDYRLFI